MELSVAWSTASVVPAGSTLNPSIYTLDRMSPGRPGQHGVAMRLTSDSRARTRPPDNELHDRGCGLVEAALAIRRLTGCEGAERALPAVLACIESTLPDSARGRNGRQRPGRKPTAATPARSAHSMALSCAPSRDPSRRAGKADAPRPAARGVRRARRARRRLKTSRSSRCCSTSDAPGHSPASCSAIPAKSSGPHGSWAGSARAAAAARRLGGGVPRDAVPISRAGMRS